MNKHIKLLARDAELTYGVWTVPDFIAGRFARSIVEQCIMCAERECIRHGSDSAHNQAVRKVIESIKEHFGDNNE